MKKITIFGACLFMLSLAACGGVGNDPAASKDSDIKTSAEADPIDRYIGTWTKKCDTLSEQDVSELNGKPVRVKETFKFDKAAAVKASYVYTLQVHTNDDVKCERAPIATVIKTGGDGQTQTLSAATATLTSSYGANELRYLGPQELKSGVTVDQLQWTESKLVNAQTNVGGAVFKPGNPVADGASGDALALFKSSTQFLLNWISGDGLPAALEDDPYLVWTRQ